MQFVTWLRASGRATSSSNRILELREVYQTSALSGLQTVVSIWPVEGNTCSYQVTSVYQAEAAWQLAVSRVGEIGLRTRSSWVRFERRI